MQALRTQAALTHKNSHGREFAPHRMTLLGAYDRLHSRRGRRCDRLKQYRDRRVDAGRHGLERQENVDREGPVQRGATNRQYRPRLHGRGSQDALAKQDGLGRRGEIKELEAEAAHATGEAKSRLQSQIATAKAGLARDVQHAKQRVETLGHEADAKALAIRKQPAQTKSEIKGAL